MSEAHLYDEIREGRPRNKNGIVVLAWDKKRHRAIEPKWKLDVNPKVVPRPFRGSGPLVIERNGVTLHPTLHDFGCPKRGGEKRSLKSSDGPVCSYCGLINVELTVDHVKAKRHGGTRAADNVVLACRKCNSGKADKHALVWMLQRREITKWRE